MIEDGCVFCDDGSMMKKTQVHKCEKRGDAVFRYGEAFSETNNWSLRIQHRPSRSFRVERRGLLDIGRWIPFHESTKNVIGFVQIAIAA